MPSESAPFILTAALCDIFVISIRGPQSHSRHSERFEARRAFLSDSEPLEARRAILSHASGMQAHSQAQKEFPGVQIGPVRAPPQGLCNFLAMTASKSRQFVGLTREGGADASKGVHIPFEDGDDDESSRLPW